jgi:2-keto-4-pentenoate hydratase/2-oxohepta-3-ene-1,7-dioic acid hydratase in catechol pathway
LVPAINEKKLSAAGTGGYFCPDYSMKIICIGRNYADHIRELANEKPEEPVLFLKPETALVLQNQEVPFPSFTQDLHHELELVLRVCRDGKDISLQEAGDFYDAIGLGIDFTARDLQAKLKSKGLPWETAKAFDYSAPLSEFIPIDKISLENGIHFQLKVNGEIRQQGNSNLMLFPFDEIISHASRFFRLLPGDVIFTGTPSGVAAVQSGDHLEGFLENTKLLDFKVL